MIKLVLITMLWALALLAAACTSSVTETPTSSSTATELSIAQTPTPAPTPISTPPPIATFTPQPTFTIADEAHIFQFNRPPTLDWQIVDSATIVVATLISATAATETISGTPTHYRPMHILQFRASQYLKGSGPTEFTVEVADRSKDGLKFGIESSALAEATRTLADRNTEWDDRPGVLFLEGPVASAIGGDEEDTSRSAGSGTTQVFNLTNNDLTNQSSFEYTIDTLNRSWLPAETSSTSGGSSDSGGVRTTETQKFITDGTVQPPPVVSISDLQTRINEIQAMLDAGDGSETYTNCVKEQVKRPWWYANWNPKATPFEGTLDSGSPAGAEFDVINASAGQNDAEYGDKERYFVGEHAHLFHVQHFDDDAKPSNGYSYSFRATRPLIEGEYELRSHLHLKAQKICNDRQGYDDPGYFTWVVTVTAPSGTLHEAFFDPVTVGTAVKADGSNGVLTPTSFTVGGTATEITGLEWASNKVVLTLGTHASLSGHVLDFIALDGSVSLSLLTADATLDSTAGTYSWPMTTEPWENGDKLMLRIREDG